MAGLEAAGALGVAVILGRSVIGHPEAGFAAFRIALLLTLLAATVSMAFFLVEGRVVWFFVLAALTGILVFLGARLWRQLVHEERLEEEPAPGSLPLGEAAALWICALLTAVGTVVNLLN